MYTEHINAAGSRTHDGGGGGGIDGTGKNYSVYGYWAASARPKKTIHIVDNLSLALMNSGGGGEKQTNEGRPGINDVSSSMHECDGKRRKKEDPQ